MRLINPEKIEYTNFLISHISGSFLQSWEWGEWQEKLGKKVYRFKITDDTENVLGSVLLVKMPLPFGKYYLYAPYGPVVNFQFSIFNFQLLTHELRALFSDALFMRIEPQNEIEGLSSFAIKSTNIQPAITMVLDVHKPDEDLLAGMHTKTRYNIRVAERHGVVIQSQLAVTPGYGLYAREAIDLIVKTQARQKYRGHSASYYEKLVDFFAVQNPHASVKVTVYKALYNKELLTSAVMVDFAKTRMYLYGGSSDDFRNVMAPYLLHWQAIADARNLGMEYYDFGGSEVAAGGERGFTRFKQGFGGRVVNYMGAYDWVFNKTAYHAYMFFRKINKITKKISPP